MAGLAEQRLRLSRAVLVVLQLAVVAPERGGLELAGDEPGAAVERVDDPALVDRLGEGLAHALVLELLHLVVEGDVARRVRGAQQELEIRIALDHAHVVGVEPLHPVDLTGLERAEPLRVVLDVADDEALDLGLLAPVVRSGLEHDLLVRLPLHEPVGAGADRVLAELRAPALDGLGARADDRLVVEARELRLPVLEGLAGLHLVVVLGMARLPPALEVPDDRGGVERRAVVELHRLADLERPHLAVARDLPLLGQRGLDLGSGAAVLHQTVEHLPREARRDAVSDNGRVELDGLALRSEDEGLSRYRRRGAQESRDDQRREREKGHRMNLHERTRRSSAVRAGPLSQVGAVRAAAVARLGPAGRGAPPVARSAKSVVWSGHERFLRRAPLPRELAGRSR